MKKKLSLLLAVMLLVSTILAVPVCAEEEGSTPSSAPTESKPTEPAPSEESKPEESKPEESKPTEPDHSTPTPGSRLVSVPSTPCPRQPGATGQVSHKEPSVWAARWPARLPPHRGTLPSRVHPPPTRWGLWTPQQTTSTHPRRGLLGVV